MDWLAPIIVAVIGGIFSYLGVATTVKASYDRTTNDFMVAQEKQNIVISKQIENVMDKIERLEAKQDRHNQVIERTFKLEQKVDDLEKRIN